MARVLIVDDQQSLRELLGYFFRDVGSEVVLVGDGQEAWELLDRGEQFDLILSDYDMPKVNGLELLIRVRFDKRTAEVKFALMSGEWYTRFPPEMRLDDFCVVYDATFIEKPPRDFAALVTQLLET